MSSYEVSFVLKPAPKNAPPDGKLSLTSGHPDAPKCVTLTYKLRGDTEDATEKEVIRRFSFNGYAGGCAWIKELARDGTTGVGSDRRIILSFQEDVEAKGTSKGPCLGTLLFAVKPRAPKLSSPLSPSPPVAVTTDALFTLLQAEQSKARPQAAAPPSATFTAVKADALSHLRQSALGNVLLGDASIASPYVNALGAPGSGGGGYAKASTAPTSSSSNPNNKACVMGAPSSKPSAGSRTPVAPPAHSAKASSPYTAPIMTPVSFMARGAGARQSMSPSAAGASSQTWSTSDAARTTGAAGKSVGKAAPLSVLKHLVVSSMYGSKAMSREKKAPAPRSSTDTVDADDYEGDGVPPLGAGPSKQPTSAQGALVRKRFMADDGETEPEEEDEDLLVGPRHGVSSSIVPHPLGSPLKGWASSSLPPPSGVPSSLLRGLQNLGNTCYMASVFVMLLHSKALVRALFDPAVLQLAMLRQALRADDAGERSGGAPAEGQGSLANWKQARDQCKVAAEGKQEVLVWEAEVKRDANAKAGTQPAWHFWDPPAALAGGQLAQALAGGDGQGSVAAASAPPDWAYGVLPSLPWQTLYPRTSVYREAAAAAAAGAVADASSPPLLFRVFETSAARCSTWNSQQSWMEAFLPPEVKEAVMAGTAGEAFSRGPLAGAAAGKLGSVMTPFRPLVPPSDVPIGLLKAHMPALFLCMLDLAACIRARRAPSLALLRNLKSAIDRHMPDFRGLRQQDAHEMLQVVLNGLETELGPLGPALADTHGTWGCLETDEQARASAAAAQDWEAWRDAHAPLPAALAAEAAAAAAEGRAPDPPPQHVSASYLSERYARVRQMLQAEWSQTQALPSRRAALTEVEVTLSCASATCGYTRTKIEYYFDLPLDLPEAASLKGATLPLSSVLGVFFGESTLELRCDKCRACKTAKLRRRISGLPNVVLLQLKRFEVDAEGRTHKIEVPVSFPGVLDVSQYCIPAPRAPVQVDLAPPEAVTAAIAQRVATAGAVQGVPAFAAAPGRVDAPGALTSAEDRDVVVLSDDDDRQPAGAAGGGGNGGEDKLVKTLQSKGPGLKGGGKVPPSGQEQRQAVPPVPSGSSGGLFGTGPAAIYKSQAPSGMGVLGNLGPAAASSKAVALIPGVVGPRGQATDAGAAAAAAAADPNSPLNWGKAQPRLPQDARPVMSAAEADTEAAVQERTARNAERLHGAGGGGGGFAAGPPNPFSFGVTMPASPLRAAAAAAEEEAELKEIREKASKLPPGVWEYWRKMAGDDDDGRLAWGLYESSLDERGGSTNAVDATLSPRDDGSVRLDDDDDEEEEDSGLPPPAKRAKLDVGHTPSKSAFGTRHGVVKAQAAVASSHADAALAAAMGFYSPDSAASTVHASTQGSEAARLYGFDAAGEGYGGLKTRSSATVHPTAAAAPGASIEAELMQAAAAPPTPRAASSPSSPVRPPSSPVTAEPPKLDPYCTSLTQPFDALLHPLVKLEASVAPAAAGEAAAQAALPAAPRTRYVLKGVVKHLGLWATSGHYTADVLAEPEAGGAARSSSSSSAGDSAWEHWDDLTVTPTQAAAVFGPDSQRSAYLLLYELEQL